MSEDLNMPDDPKPREMVSTLMARTDRLIGVNRTVTAAIEEMGKQGIPGDVTMRVATRLLQRAKELSK